LARIFFKSLHRKRKVSFRKLEHSLAGIVEPIVVVGMALALALAFAAIT